MTPRHPAFAVLADLADGLPAPAPAAEHATACAACAAVVEDLRRAAALLAAGAAAEPPRAAVRRALRIPLAARLGAAAEAVRALVARLVFDSGATAAAPAFALRGGGPRRTVHRAGPYDLEIAVGPEGIRGSVLPRRPGEALPAGGRAILLRGRRRSAPVPLDARGRFAIPFDGRGRAALLLEFPGVSIRVPDLSA